MKKALRIYIFGTVQGVFFRNYIKEHAEKNKVNGYIRNKDDGSVEAWFEGNNEDVDKMVELCKGYEHAVVNRLDVIEEKLQDMKEFKIIKF